ncbi:hypothetical protein [Halovenus halobia]|uniref:hypothetical protein n=1 Tax=Halovenus halobia TaxID=3396622 RepID=UPI003F5511B3
MSNSQSEVLVETTPTVKPVLVRLALTIALGIVIIGAVFAAPSLFGSTEQANIALVVAQLLVLIAIAKLLVEMLILLRTRYIVTTDAVRREFSLLGRTKIKEVPHGLVRSTEYRQSRTEYILGVGSIVLNQGLGDLRFTAVPQHRAVYRQIRDRTESQQDAGGHSSI